MEVIDLYIGRQLFGFLAFWLVANQQQVEKREKVKKQIDRLLMAYGNNKYYVYIFDVSIAELLWSTHVV